MCKINSGRGKKNVVLEQTNVGFPWQLLYMYNGCTVIREHLELSGSVSELLRSSDFMKPQCSFYKDLFDYKLCQVHFPVFQTYINICNVC